MFIAQMTLKRRSIVPIGLTSNNVTIQGFILKRHRNFFVYFYTVYVSQQTRTR